jgi:ATP-dependent DNA ligase
VKQTFPIAPPIEPMLAKLTGELPSGPAFLYEPKWDGFRAIVFRGGGDVYIQSRDLRPLDRYFPELHDALIQRLPDGCVLDGEIVIATPNGLDFDALQLRLHPAASRVAKLAAEMPSAFVAFDALAAGGKDLRKVPQAERRSKLERFLAKVKPPVYLTPVTRDVHLAAEWLSRFEGAGLDGVMVKPADAPYQAGKRTMFKVKHSRTADCVVAGFRWHKAGKGSSSAPCCSGFTTTATACSTWASRRRSRWRAGRSWRPNSSRCGGGRSRTIRGATGRRAMARGRRGCQAARAAGAPARICRGSRSGSSACAR